MDEDELVISRDAGKVRWLLLNNVKRLNAISTDMAKAFLHKLDEAENDPVIRVVLLRGAGENFSSGADLSSLDLYDTRSTEEFRNSMNAVALKFVSMKKPVISVLHGYSLGGALELSESTDIRVASASAKIGQPEIRIGINAGAGGNVVLPRLVGKGRAMLLSLTGKTLSASEAQSIGLVDAVFSDDMIFQEAEKLAAGIAEMPSLTVETCKRIINASQELGLEDGLKLEKEGFIRVISSDETKERINKFLKR